MRLRKIYIFIIILSLLMPETTSENTDPSSEEKKGWSLFKRKDKENKEVKEKSDRKGFLGIFKRKRKKDVEEDLIVTEESNGKFVFHLLRLNHGLSKKRFLNQFQSRVAKLIKIQIKRINSSVEKIRPRSKL